MTIKTADSSLFMKEFAQELEVIHRYQQHCDPFHYKLYFSHVICLMEKYLYDLFIYEISNNKNAFQAMCKQPKFAHQTYSLQQILYQDIKQIVINSVKNIVWHRLNDVDPLFKSTLGIQLSISKQLTSLLTTRHHIVHRNGFDLDGKEIVLNLEDLIECSTCITSFIQDIDKKYLEYLSR